MAIRSVLKTAGVVGGLLILAACATHKGPDVVATSDSGNTGAVQPSGPTPGSQADFEQNAGNRVFFAYDQFSLTPQAEQVLARQAAWLKQYPATRVVLSGNCDERGTREYNLALGERRAESARVFLVGHGVDGSRITTVSYGKERPIDPRSTEEAWSVNRNATTTLVGASS